MKNVKKIVTLQPRQETCRSKNDRSKADIIERNGMMSDFSGESEARLSSNLTLKITRLPHRPECEDRLE